MTDQQEQIEQHVAAEQQEQARVAQEEQQAPARSQEELLRDAVASNFIGHCVNGRVAESQQHQVDPRIVGGIDAVSSVIERVINLAGKEGIEQQFGAVMDGLGLVSVNGTPILQLIVNGVITKAAEKGAAFTMLGELQGLAMTVMVNGAMNQVYSACSQKMAESGAADPMKPFAPEHEAAPAADAQAEDLPESFQQGLTVARKQVESREVRPYKRRSKPNHTRPKPKGSRRRK